MAWAPRLSGASPSPLDLIPANGYHLRPPVQRISVEIEEEARRLRHGSAVLTARREPMIVELSGHVRGTTPSETRSRRDNLHRALGDGAPVTLRLRDSTGGELGRELFPARLLSLEDTEILGSVHDAINFRLELSSSLSLWRGTSDQTQTTTVLVSAAGTSNVSLSNAGDADAILDTVIIGGAAFTGSIRITNTTTGKAWRLLGLVLGSVSPDSAVIVQGLEGDVLRYDVSSQVSFIGVSMDSADGTVFDLAPGTNNLQIQVASAGVISLTFQFSWRPHFHSY